ncbi:MAG: diaminopropionate ammonia-lyase [Kineosporiaceae bacterium]|nr:diaminopropionate ammonia-lyase [Kineosporiaceae bacterium]
MTAADRAQPDSLASDPTWFARGERPRWTCPPPPGEVVAFHRTLPGYSPTPLVELPALATELGVGRVFVKDESQRFALSAFKILGASWAITQALTSRTPHTRPGEGGAWSLDELRSIAAAQPAVLVTATDGNHGRAVAHMARLIGVPAHIVVPDVVPQEALDRIAAEGAQVSVIAGSYDEAVDEAARIAAAEPGGLLIQDTAWPGYETVPQWIVDGYATLVGELDEQLRDVGVEAPDLVAVPVGVGSLAQAVIAHYRRPGLPRHTAVLSVEPDSAACTVASLQAGRPVTVPTGATVMAGLNCGTLSSLAWPVIAAGLDAAVAVPDADTVRAVDDLGALGISSGPSGASSLAGVRAALTGHRGARRRAALHLPTGATVVLLSTEGTHR